MRVGNEYKDRKLKKTVSKNVRLTVKDATEFEKYAKRRGIPFTALVMSVVEIDCPEIGMDGVLRKIALPQVLFKCFACLHKRCLPIISLRIYRTNIIGEICDYLLS